VQESEILSFTVLLNKPNSPKVPKQLQCSQLPLEQHFKQANSEKQKKASEYDTLSELMQSTCQLPP